MREKVKDIDRLYHIIESIDNVFEFMEGQTYESFQSNKLLFFGVVKNIEIIGEASYMLTLDFKETHAGVPWADVIGMRHILVHGYYTTKPLFIWDTYMNDLQPLRDAVEGYIIELEKELE